MPRLSPEEWRRLDPIARWLIACRASVLFMTLTAAILGGLMSWRLGSFSWELWLATMAGLLFAHATNNLVNDYVDFRRGIDADDYFRNQYSVHVLADGLMTEKQFWGYLVANAGTALLAGIWLISQRGGLTLDLMLLGAFFALFYTWPLKQLALGEPAVLLVWGPLMVGGTYYIQSGTWNTAVIWVGLAFALGPTAVLFGKHTDKLLEDQRKGVRTLPVLLGEQLARHCTLGLICIQYVLCVFLFTAGDFSWPVLLVLVNILRLRPLVRALGNVRPETCPANYPRDVWPLWYAAYTFRHMRQFTTLLLLAVLIDTLLQ